MYAIELVAVVFVINLAILSGKHVTNPTFQTYRLTSPLFVHSPLIFNQLRPTQITVYIGVLFDLSLSKTMLGQAMFLTKPKCTVWSDVKTLLKVRFSVYRQNFAETFLTLPYLRYYLSRSCHTMIWSLPRPLYV